MSDHNLTGGQIQEILDTLLYQALEPIITYTDVYDLQLVYLLGKITNDKKRKVYSVSECPATGESLTDNDSQRGAAVDLICKALACSDTSEKIEYIRKVGLERNIIQSFVVRFVTVHYERYITLYRKLLVCKDSEERKAVKLRLDAILGSVGCSRRSDFFVCISQAYEASLIYKQYFQNVLDQYVKLCSQQAKVYVTSKKNEVDFYDVFQDFMRNVIVGINKYDSSKGALTPYLKWWIYNAQTCGSKNHEYGVVMSVSQSQKKKMAMGQATVNNFAVSLDALKEEESETGNLHERIGSTETVDAEAQAHQLSTNIRILAKAVDPNGLARLSMDIGEHFSKTERDIMRRHMESIGFKNTKL